MSRIGKQEIQIPKGITITQDGGVLKVVGPKGTLTKIFRDDITVTIGADTVTLNVKRNDTSEDFFINQLTDGQTGEIFVDRIERNWFINNLRDRRIDYTKPIFLKDIEDLQNSYYIDKIIDDSNIDLEKDWLELENFRDKYLQIRLIFTNFADETNLPKDVKLLMNFIIEEEKVSLS